jgi:hypothetical protein
MDYSQNQKEGFDTHFAYEFQEPGALRADPSARGPYMLRKSFVSVIIRFRVKAREKLLGLK